MIEYTAGMTFEYHEVVGLFREMPGQDFRDLVDDVALHGVRNAVWMYQGQIIDGRHRSKAWLAANQEELDKVENITLECPRCMAVLKTQRALAGTMIDCDRCQQAHADEVEKAKAAKKEPPPMPPRVPVSIALARRVVPPLPVCEWSDKDGAESLVAFVMSQNLQRRHLGTAERAMLVVEAVELEEEEARQRQLDGLRKGKAASVAHRCANGETKGKTSKKLAKIAGVSARTVEHATKIRRTGSKALQDAARSGKIGMKKAAAIAPLSPEKQLAAMAREAKRVKKTNRRLDLKEALGKGGAHLEAARKALQKAAKAIGGWNATKTERAIEKAQEALASDTERLLAG